MTVNKLRGAAACLCVLSQIFTWIDPIHLAWVDVGWTEIPYSLRVQTSNTRKFLVEFLFLKSCFILFSSNYQIKISQKINVFYLILSNKNGRLHAQVGATEVHNAVI